MIVMGVSSNHSWRIVWGFVHQNYFVLLCLFKNLIRLLLRLFKRLICQSSKLVHRCCCIQLPTAPHQLYPAKKSLCILQTNFNLLCSKQYSIIKLMSLRSGRPARIFQMSRMTYVLSILKMNSIWSFFVFVKRVDLLNDSN